MAKLSIEDIRQGQLVNKIRVTTIEFITMDEEKASVEVQLKPLSFAETDKLHKRLGDGDEKVLAEWVAKSIVKDDGKPEFTADQVNKLFSRELVIALMDEIMLMNQAKKIAKAESEKKQE